MNVPISGAGIAGSTLAFWLRKYGFAAVPGAGHGVTATTCCTSSGKCR